MHVREFPSQAGVSKQEQGQGHSVLSPLPVQACTQMSLTHLALAHSSMLIPGAFSSEPQGLLSLVLFLSLSLRCLNHSHKAVWLPSATLETVRLPGDSGEGRVTVPFQGTTSKHSAFLLSRFAFLLLLTPAQARGRRSDPACSLPGLLFYPSGLRLSGLWHSKCPRSRNLFSRDWQVFACSCQRYQERRTDRFLPELRVGRSSTRLWPHPRNQGCVASFTCRRLRGVSGERGTALRTLSQSRVAGTVFILDLSPRKLMQKGLLGHLPEATLPGSPVPPPGSLSLRTLNHWALLPGPASAWPAAWDAVGPSTWSSAL